MRRSLPFESNEYWLTHYWDRDDALREARSEVADQFTTQEALTVRKIENVIDSQGLSRVEILDVGCGTGRISAQICQRLAAQVSIVLVDLNLETLCRAKRAVPQDALVGSYVASVYELEQALPPRPLCDVVVCLDLLHHLGDLEEALGSLQGRLRRGGWLIGNTFVSDGYQQFDRLKYGGIVSARRRLLYWVSRLAYVAGLERVVSIAKRRGWMRIAPIPKSHILASLNRRFGAVESVEEGQYLWFAAQSA